MATPQVIDLPEVLTKRKLDKLSEACRDWLLWGQFEDFKHAVRLIQRSYGHLYIRESFNDHNLSTWESTRLWVELWLLERLEPYADLSPGEIMRAADSDAFRYLRRESRCDLINELRKRYVHHIREFNIDLPDKSGPPTLVDILPPPDGRPPKLEPEGLKGILQEYDNQLTPLLGEYGNDLAVVASQFPDGMEDNWKVVKIQLLEAIAKARQVTIRQARNRLHKLNEIMRQAMLTCREVRYLYEELYYHAAGKTRQEARRIKPKVSLSRIDGDDDGWN